MSAKSSEMLGLSQAAEYCSFSNTQYLRKLFIDGKIPAKKVFVPELNVERWVVSKEALDVFLARPRTFSSREDGKQRFFCWLSEVDKKVLTEAGIEFQKTPTHASRAKARKARSLELASKIVESVELTK